VVARLEVAVEEGAEDEAEPLLLLKSDNEREVRVALPRRAILLKMEMPL
jgi:hypothetical protein